MNTRSEERNPDPRLAVLWGEASAESLSDAAEKTAADRSLALLRKELTPPAFDRARLLTALRVQPTPPRFAVRPARPRGLAWLAGAALLALAAGLAVWLVWDGPQNVVKTPGEGLPKKAPVAERQSDGSWRLQGFATLRASAGAQLDSREDGLMVLRGGRAELVTEGSLAAPVELVSALGDSMRLAVAGPSHSALRVLPAGKGMALSVYEGTPGSVSLRRKDDSTALVAGRNVDGILYPAEAGLEKKRAAMVLWPDVTAELPPVNDGEVLVRLAGGRVLRGYVSGSTAEGVQIQGSWARKGVNGLEAGPAAVAESVLRREVAAWVPAETPRGRDTYARWLEELAPQQLEEAKRRWFWYLVETEAGRAPDTTPHEFLQPEHLLPEVAYRIQRRGGESFLQIVPKDKELGPGWEMDEHGKMQRIGSAPAAKTDPDF